MKLRGTKRPPLTVSRAGALVALVILAASTTAAVPTVAGGSVAGGCAQGQQKKVRGVSVLVFCGPARATVRLLGGDYAGSRQVTFGNGTCASHGDDLYVFIGAVPARALKSDGLDARPVTGANYFVLRTTYKPGAHQFGNKVYFGYENAPWSLTALTTRVTVKTGLRSGVFAGRLLASDVDRVTGSFTCLRSSG